MDTRRLLSALVGLVLCVQSAPAQEPTPEEKVLNDLYGRRIANVKTTASPNDDQQLARELLIAASDSGQGDKLRLLLAKTALELVTPLDSDASVQLARQAVEIAEMIQPLPAREKARIDRDIAVKCVKLARGARKSADRMRTLAKEALRAHLRYARIVIRNREDLTEAQRSVAEAQVLMRRHRLKDIGKAVAKVRKELQTAQTRQRALRGAMVRLEDARRSGDRSRVRTIRKALGQLYLQYDGDLVKAGEYLAGTGDEREGPVTAAADFITDSKIDPQTVVSTAEALTKLIESLSGAARMKVADCTSGMCEAYLAGNPTGLDAVKAKLMLVRLQSMLIESPENNLLKRLTEAYNGVNGKVRILDAARVRVTYDFSDKAQIKDWIRSAGEWRIVKGVLACKTPAGGRGEIRNRIRFRLDRPLRITLNARGSREIRMGVSFYHKGSAFPYSGAQFSIGRYGAAARIPRRFSQYRQFKLREESVYRFDISCDGKGDFTWSLNGKALHDFLPRPGGGREPSELKGSLEVFLRTRGAYKTPTAFDDIVIEGEPILGTNADTDDDEPSRKPAIRPS